MAQPARASRKPAFHALARQSANYFANQVTAWKTCTRPRIPMGLMAVVAQKLSEAEMRAAPAYVGNSMRCVSCHFDAVRLADLSPLWAAFASYPAYRSKTKSVTTFQQWLQGCFEYSMNGRAPPLGAPDLVALAGYAYWLASGAPHDPKLAGAQPPGTAHSGAKGGLRPW